MDKVVPRAGKPPQDRVNKANCRTFAAKWNRGVLEELQKALARDPELDLATLLSPSYSAKLQSYKAADYAMNSTRPRRKFPDHDIRSRIDAGDPSEVVYELSPELQDLLQAGGSVSESIVNLVAESEVLYKGVWAAAVMVFRLSKDMVVKFTDENSAVSEYESLAYVQKELPGFPAPRPHGVIRLGTYGLLFTDFVPGLSLEKAWPQMDHDQKRSISGQIDVLFADLRSLPIPADAPLGNVRGRGCRDGRRGVRINSTPIRSTEEFEDWIFAGSKTASTVYTRFLRDLLPETTVKCVFTHGDLRPANIIVEKSVDPEEWRICAIIDWETSGFYPEYWESAKMTNNLTPRDDCDWYNHLPTSISPHRYSSRWLVDRLWDQCMLNS
ncbi:APH-domain-containing protein [Pleurostoma richardsiae]|uniref:APH-domain-containing protein n=1 Tax=Pleurostoma richardsiae TaxID=41990 RepID=A0AA38RIS4_9PEZI|nr:APH-domain-containing protein [Pleurostoma richardsiae]